MTRWNALKSDFLTDALSVLSECLKKLPETYKAAAETELPVVLKTDANGMVRFESVIPNLLKGKYTITALPAAFIYSKVAVPANQWVAVWSVILGWSILAFIPFSIMIKNIEILFKCFR
ncbi:MAG: hypothetical protein GXP32_10330 [Kiritimatiellaeota bacterium]|nr:hypothetical protein [Kiritimatiellota bacterium]